MSTAGITAVVGTIAAICTTGAFVPQILKIRKQGGEDLSYATLSVYLFGVLLWLAYGIIFHAPAVIWANVVAAVLVSMALLMKATWKTSAPAAPAPGVSRAGRLRVAVDMDEVIADALARHLSLYNRVTGEDLTPQRIAEVGLEAAIPEKLRPVFERLPHEDGFFDDLELIADAREAVHALSQQFDVFITSAAMEVPRSFDAKFRWLGENFPFIPTSNLVFCGDKQVLDADYLVDDRSRHFRRFRGTGILFTAPHNAREKAPLRANDWNEVLAILCGNRQSEFRDRHSPKAKAAQAPEQGMLTASN
jgi:5'(3')-deoxyribonucleotidase/uncharacterized protein with PQ loop repeat